MSEFIKNWDIKPVKNVTLKQLRKNAGEAGSFIVSDSRKRLQRISEPEFGRKYRRNFVASLLDFNVGKGGDLILEVGVKESKASRENRAYRYHGFYVEMGSRTKEAQPFLRPAVFNNGRTIVELLTR